MLNEDEKIDSWDVVVKTTEGRKFGFCDLRIDIPQRVSEILDEILEEEFSCTWVEEEK